MVHVLCATGALSDAPERIKEEMEEDTSGGQRQRK